MKNKTPCKIKEHIYCDSCPRYCDSCDGDENNFEGKVKTVRVVWDKLQMYIASDMSKIEVESGCDWNDPLVDVTYFVELISLLYKDNKLIDHLESLVKEKLSHK